MPVTVDPMPLPAVVELVNGWGGTPRREAEEDDWPYPPRGRVLDRWDAAAAIAPDDDAGLAAVADALHPVFAAGSAQDAADLLNAVLEATAVRPVLVADDRGERAAWVVPDAGRALLAAAAVALRDHLAEHALDRLGTCSGRRCADVYVDSSPGGHRRFCSITCQNRARVAAYRSRRAAPEG